MKPLAGKFFMAASLIGLALCLLFVRTDRPVLSLLPTPGQGNQVAVPDTGTFIQQFTANQTSISRVGFYFSATTSLPAEIMSLRLLRDGQEIGASSLSAVFIDNEGMSTWQFSPAVATKKNDKITAQLQIPALLKDKISLKVRVWDETFNQDSVSLLINNQPQASPLAYEVFARYRPPLALQVAVLALLAAAALFIKPQKTISQDILAATAAFCLTCAYLFPLTWEGHWSWYLAGIQTSAALSAYWWLRLRGSHYTSSFIGAAVFAYTAWWPLLLSGSRGVFGGIAVGALLAIILSKKQPVSRRYISGALAIACTALVIVQAVDVPALIPLERTATVRDVLLDPYQVAGAQKVSSYGQLVPWHNFGAYIGIPASLIAFIGIVSSGRKHKYVAGTIFIIVASMSLSSFLPGGLNTYIAQTSIVLVAAMAFFISEGLAATRRYLGSGRPLTTFLVSSLCLIVILDMWYVAADVLETLAVK